MRIGMELWTQLVEIRLRSTYGTPLKSYSFWPSRKVQQGLYQ